MNKDEIAGLVKYARDWPGVEGDALSAGVVGQKLNDMADALTALSARVETLEPVLMKRACGGWLAVSPQHYSLKIAVRAVGRDEARVAYSAAFNRWKALLQSEHNV